MAKEQYTIDVFRECIGQYKDKDIVVVLFIALKTLKNSDGTLLTIFN